MRLLKRFGAELAAFDAYRLPMVDGIILGPERLHQLDKFAGAQRAVLEWCTDDREFLRPPSDADTENNAPVAQHVQRCDRLGACDVFPNRGARHPRLELH